MAEYIANEDLEVNFVVTPGPPDIVYSGDVGIDPVKVVPIKAGAAKIDNKLICMQQITLTWAGPPTQCPHTSALYDFVSGVGSISAGSTKCKADNLACLLENDIGNCAGTWKLKVVPFTVVACTCVAKIATAGQTKVKGT